MFKRKKDRILVLRRIAYKENLAIIEAFTENAGKKSFTLPLGKKSSRNRILVKPPNFLEIEFLNSGKSYSKITRVDLLHNYQEVYTNIKKSSVVFFLTEILRNLIQEQDQKIFYWILNRFIEFDKETFDPDFHLNFLKDLTGHLGILPEKDENGIIFAFRKAVRLNEAESMILNRFLQTGKADNHVNRRKIINWWIQYISYYLDHFKSPKSLPVLEEIFKD